MRIHLRARTHTGGRGSPDPAGRVVTPTVTRYFNFFFRGGVILRRSQEDGGDALGPGSQQHRARASKVENARETGDCIALSSTAGEDQRRLIAAFCQALLPHGGCSGQNGQPRRGPRRWGGRKTRIPHTVVTVCQQSRLAVDRLDGAHAPPPMPRQMRAGVTVLSPSPSLLQSVTSTIARARASPARRARLCSVCLCLFLRFPRRASRQVRTDSWTAT